MEMHNVECEGDSDEEGEEEFAMPLGDSTSTVTPSCGKPPSNKASQVGNLPPLNQIEQNVKERERQEEQRVREERGAEHSLSFRQSPQVEDAFLALFASDSTNVPPASGMTFYAVLK